MIGKNGSSARLTSPVLKRFARHASLAIRDARLLEDAQARIRDREIVNQIAQILGSKLEPQELFTEIAKQITQELNCTHCTIFLKEKVNSRDLLVPKITVSEVGPKEVTHSFELDEGLLGLVYQEGKSRIFPNAAAHPHFTTGFELKEYHHRSLLIAPIKMAGYCIGMISADQDELNWFGEDVLWLIDALASQAGIAIARARSLGFLHSISGQLIRTISTEDVGHVLQQVLSGAIEITNISSGVIHRLSDDEQSIIETYIYPADEYYPEPRKDKHGNLIGVTQDVITSRKTLKIKNPESDKRLNSKLRKWIKSFLAKPIIYEQGVVGVLTLVDKDKHEFTEIEDTVLSTLTSQAAAVIHSARVFEQKQVQLLSQINAVKEIADTITSPNDLTEVLNSILDWIISLMEKATLAIIAIFDADTGKLTAKAVRGEPVDERYHRDVSIGEGIVGWVAQNKEPQIVQDVKEDARYLPLRDDIRSELAVPLLRDDEVIGVLDIEGGQVGVFTMEDCKLAEAIAGLTVVAIENARLYQQAHNQQREQIVAVKEIAQTIAAPLPLTEALENILDLTVPLIGEANLAVVRLLDKTTNELVLKAVRGDKIQEKYGRIPINKGITGWVARNRKTALVQDVNKDDRYLSVLEGTKSELSVPMLKEAELIGVLSIQHPNKNAFSETHVEITEAIAELAVVAIENTQLFEEKEYRLAELTALYETSQVIARESGSVTSVLKKILREAVKVSKAEAGQLFLINDNGEIRIAITHKLDKLRGITLQPGEGMVGRVVETGESLFTNDYHNEVYKADIMNKSEYQDLLEAMVQVPLKWKGKIIGVLAISSRTEGRRFMEEDVRLLENFAGPAAIAIANAREISFRQVLLNNSPNAIVAANTSGEVTHINEAALDVLGYNDESELIGKKVQETIYWDGLEEAKRVYNMMVASKNKPVKRIETILKNKQGESIPVLLSTAILKDEQGERLGSVGLVEDQRIVALRGRARKLFNAIEAINRSEELQEVLDTILLNSVELLGAEAGCILLREGDYFIVKTSYGCPAEIEDELKPKLDDSGIGQFAQRTKPKAISDVASIDPYLPLNGDGVSALVAPLRSEDFIIGILYLESNRKEHFSTENELIHFLADQAAVAINRAQLLQEREKTQENLVKSAQAVTAGLIATGVVHEVKNSLNNIALTMQNVANRLEREPNIKSKKLYSDKLRSIETEVMRSYDLAQRLQKFGQRLEPQKKIAYLNEVISNALAVVDSALRKQKMKVELRLDSALDKPKSATSKGYGGNPVEIDERQIEQVVINLILNAIDASYPRTRLVIETQMFDDRVEFSVTDFGKGISSDIMPSVFKSFFTTKEDGVGLGLHVSKIIVEDNHQGRIVIQKSKPGKGSTFSVSLPKNIYTGR